MAYDDASMPDPQVLYAVTAVVLVGLVVWAFVVLTRRPDEIAPEAHALRKEGALPTPAVAGAAAGWVGAGVDRGESGERC